SVQIEEGFAGERDPGMSPPVERDGVANEGAHSPARAVGVAAPALLGAEPRAKLAGTDRNDVIERDLLAGPVLHRRDAAAAVWRVMRVSCPDGHRPVQFVAEQRIDLVLVQAV